jgi:hypothetical protein
MSGIEERRKGWKKKLAHDDELRFKVNNRRNWLLGQWAAERMGISGDEAAAYAKAVVLSDFEEVGDADVVRKVLTDLKEKGIEATEEEIRAEMTNLFQQATEDVMKES